MLLIVAGLDDAKRRELSEEAASYALDTLVEVHDEEGLTRALALERGIFGINNRDLRTFTTDLGVTIHLLPSIPAGRPRVFDRRSVESTMRLRSTSGS